MYQRLIKTNRNIIGRYNSWCKSFDSCFEWPTGSWKSWDDIRTSAAAGATAVLLTEGTVDLYNPKVISSTMGSLFQVPIVNALDDNEAVKWLNYNSINIMVADLDGEEYYYSANLKGPFALVIGNENRGANDIWRKAAYKKIKIPILGTTESLNASVAAGIILYDAVRQRLG